MAKDQGIVQTRMRPRPPVSGRAGGRLPTPPPPQPSPEPRKKPFNALKFVQETRAEARKVVWTSWKETWITSVMVGVLVLLTALFFFGVDWLLGLGVGGLLKLVSAG